MFFVHLLCFVQINLYPLIHKQLLIRVYALLYFLCLINYSVSPDDSGAASVALVPLKFSGLSFKLPFSSTVPSSNLVIAAICSPSSNLISFTPYVALPCSLISFTGIRMVTPLMQVIIKSSFTATSIMPTKVPVLSVTLMVFTPFPPRLVIRYSSIAVFLPKPFSLTTNTVLDDNSSEFTQIIPTTSSPGSSASIPATPIAPRPVGLTLSSLKRIARPLFTAIIISLLPSVSFASSNSSPSLIVIAFTPVCLGRLKSSSAVFLMIPFLVHKTIL